jgi:hypothetical protein
LMVEVKKANSLKFEGEPSPYPLIALSFFKCLSAF